MSATENAPSDSVVTEYDSDLPSIRVGAFGVEVIWLCGAVTVGVFTISGDAA